MKQPNGPDGEYVRERKLPRRDAPPVELPRACGTQCVSQMQSPLDQRRLPGLQAAMPCIP